MLHYPFEDILRIPYYFEEEKFDSSKLQDFLSKFSTQNLNVYVFSQDFEKECNLQEKIYGTFYCVENLPPNFISASNENSLPPEI